MESDIKQQHSFALDHNWPPTKPSANGGVKNSEKN